MAKDDKKNKPDAEDEPSAAEAQPASSVWSSKKKLALIVGGIVFLLLAISVPAVFMVFKKGGGEKAPHDAANDEQAWGGIPVEAEGLHDRDEIHEDEEALGAIFPLDTFVVNLQGDRFLRSQIQIEFVQRDVPKRFYPRLVQTRDALVMLLTSKKPEDINTPQGKEMLKSEIKDLLNEILRKQEVKNVYFTQFVIQ